MALAPGASIGHYNVGALLGEGGMGEVYRARDTKLERDVALKLLSPELAEDPERLARLHREARMLASLDHPNINAIYAVEEVAGTHFLVLQLVEGTTLAERLASGRMPLDAMIRTAALVAVRRVRHSERDALESSSRALLCSALLCSPPEETCRAWAG